MCVFHTFTSDWCVFLYIYIWFCVFLYIYIWFLCISIHLHLIFCAFFIHLHLIFCVYFFKHLHLIFVLFFLFGVEWVSDCCLTSSQHIILAILWRKEVNFHWNDDEVRFVLDQHGKLDLYGYNSPREDMSLHSDTLSWFRANESLLFLLNAAWLAGKQQIPI